jgi:hypothetical protein
MMINKGKIMKKPEIDVAIYLRGITLRPEHVTQMLGVQPTRYQTKGGYIFDSKKGIAKIGYWAIYAQTDSIDIFERINELLKKIGIQSTPLDKIEGVEEAYLDIFVAKTEVTDGRPVEFKISKEQLSDLARLGLSIEISAAT